MTTQPEPTAPPREAHEAAGLEKPKASVVPPQQVVELKTKLEARLKTCGLAWEEVPFTGSEPNIRIQMRCGRDSRPIYLSESKIDDFLAIPFEKYIFLADLDAICAYDDGYIEAAIRPLRAQLVPGSIEYQKLFGIGLPAGNLEKVKVELEPWQNGLPRIEITPASEVFRKLLRGPLLSMRRLTLKLSGCHVTTHDQALSVLKKISNALFFQIDLLTDVPLSLQRERSRSFAARRWREKRDVASELQYPRREFDEAPLSLYWYARSAHGMPLLQFLAFYQVLEFYFPTYSRAEAQRRLKGILKDPTFRGDRDADVAKLLTAIRTSRSGGYGDERSQLRATVLECIAPDAIREFLTADAGRREFYSAKSKGSSFHAVPLGNPNADLRDDVADRIYDIRCKIVHTKSDSRDTEVELLLPFSKDAEQLFFDIELVQYLAQQVLVAASLTLQTGA